jgi:hypothetical protein
MLEAIARSYLAAVPVMVLVHNMLGVDIAASLSVVKPK